jgi:hypothetical protein
VGLARPQNSSQIHFSGVTALAFLFKAGGLLELFAKNIKHVLPPFFFN